MKALLIKVFKNNVNNRKCGNRKEINVEEITKSLSLPVAC